MQSTRSLLHLLFLALLISSSFQPLESSTDWPLKFPAKEHCSKCGLCETSFIKHVKDACAFLEPSPATSGSRMDELEFQVHGRGRKLNDMVWKDSKDDNNNQLAEEARFGVMHEPMKLAKGRIEDAQWTGLVTGIALAMLEANQVDAVVCIAASDSNWNEPEPIIAKTKEEVLRGRGVKPALAPSLKVLDEVQADPTIRRLLFCGVGCAVQAFRAVQHRVKLDQVYVLGTNCADNSPTPEAADRFVKTALDIDQGARKYEFMQDFRVHVKTDNTYLKKPYFCLPGTVAEASIAKSCRACFDYTNGLADVVVGYMGAPLEADRRMDQSLQTLTIRNERGATIVETAIQAGYVTIDGLAMASGSHELLAMATTESDVLVQAMLGGNVPAFGMPLWLGELLALVVQKLGPKGVSFARYSIDYHILRNYLHVVNEWGEERTRRLMPDFSRVIVDHYMAMPNRKLQNLRNQIVNRKIM
ncbi:hypothetical protein MPSEU_000133200 [Mayamaea pseudoterrestris]|nr:hypothetical protein MPSEU_000133200 [Mayamaea pseudoterrestris]